MQRLLDSVRGWGALPWLGLAWLAGRMPGPTMEGLTGQPVSGPWWWHAAAGVLVVVAVVDAVRAGAVADRIDRAALGVWSSNRRWTSTIVVGWLVLAVLAAVQWLDGGAVRTQLLSFLAGAAVVAVGRRRTVGGAAVGHLAVGTALLAVMTLVASWLAVRGWLHPPMVFADAEGGALVEDPDWVLHGYYVIKQAVVVPVAAHNVLAAFLLAGAPAVALATVRRPRRWWPWLVVVGLALAATLSRGALVAGVVAMGVAWLLHDRTTARRLGVVVAIASVGIGVALAQLGAAVPGEPDDPTSVVARTELWSAAWDAFVDEPLTGIGLDGLRERTAERGVTVHEHAHSLPLHALATLGLPGLLGVVAVWGGIVAAGARQLDRDRRTVVLVGMAGLGALAMVDEVALRPATIGLLALLALVATAPREPG